MSLPLVFRPIAAVEFDAAIAWYRIKPDRIVIIAVFHTSRDPAILQSRK